jgi:methyltransferase (TIGR00027 family)
MRSLIRLRSVNKDSDRMDLTNMHRTAFTAARQRALHLLVDGEPKIFIDQFAIQLTGDEPSELIELRPTLPPSTAAWVLRNRYAEDRLADSISRGVRQYVLLGAGLDSFACRHFGSMGQLTVYEVDDPPLQAWKRARLAELGVVAPAECVYVPCDFESRPLAQALAEGGFRPDLPTCIAWLGVTQYLSHAAIAHTLGWVRSLATGSEIVLAYVVPESRNNIDQRRLRAAGVPFNTYFTPEAIATFLRRSGLARIEHLTRERAAARYFADRTDGLVPMESELLVSAVVADPA